MKEISVLIFLIVEIQVLILAYGIRENRKRVDEK